MDDDDDSAEDNGTYKASGWSEVPAISTKVKRAVWKAKAASSPYKLVKKKSYNIPSYCDRMLVRVIPNVTGSGPHLQLLVGDMNYRVLPGAFL
jgi:hypothetical protein